MGIEIFVLAVLAFSDRILSQRICNNAIIANHNFLTAYSSFDNEIPQIINANMFKNHLISTFSTCKWDSLLVVTVPNLSWEHYEHYSDQFSFLQTYLYGSGTIDQVPRISKERSEGRMNVVNDLVLSIEYKCQIEEDKVIFVKGNNSLAGFEKYIDSSKRLIVLEYDDDFLATADEEEIKRKLSLIDSEIGSVLGRAPSWKNNLLLIGSHTDGGTGDVVFPSIFNKNKNRNHEDDMYLKEKKEKARNSRLGFLTYKAKFAPVENDGILFTELKTELIDFVHHNEYMLKIAVGAALGLLTIVFFFF